MAMTKEIKHHLTDAMLMAYAAGNLPEAFKASDTLMLGERHKTRQDYRTLELQRWAIKRASWFWRRRRQTQRWTQ